MSVEEKFYKMNYELQQKIIAETEKVKEGHSDKNILQLQTILEELQNSIKKKNIVFSFPRFIIDSWDYSDVLGVELMELAALYEKM